VAAGVAPPVVVGAMEGQMHLEEAPLQGSCRWAISDAEPVVLGRVLCWCTRLCHFPGPLQLPATCFPRHVECVRQWYLRMSSHVLGPLSSLLLLLSGGCAAGSGCDGVPSEHACARGQSRRSLNPGQCSTQPCGATCHVRYAASLSYFCCS
jgi:hypothetical protein